MPPLQNWVLLLAILNAVYNIKIMKRGWILSGILLLQLTVPAQVTGSKENFSVLYNNPHTSVKSQGQTGTCWSFSTTALLESELLKKEVAHPDLSEMFTVRNIYVEKAKNYLMRQGAAQFGEGSLGHDVIRAVATYGALPEEAYPGLTGQQTNHNHSLLNTELRAYLDKILQSKPLVAYWQTGFNNILDKHLGKLPGAFTYNQQIYTPASFAKDLMKFDGGDYVNITSFTHKPFYKSFILDVPDNFSNGSYYNLPLNEMLQTVNEALKNGHTIMWDADVSNNGFHQDKGLALFLNPSNKTETISVNTPEETWDAARRQMLFENLTTQDDHLMQITGAVLSKDGKMFYTVKNSWGEVGPYQGFIQVSEAYFAINTISLVVPRASISSTLLEKLK